MSITPLSAARIAGEVGLAGGTITGSTYAVKYSKEIVVIRKEKDTVEQAQKEAVRSKLQEGFDLDKIAREFD